MEEIGKFVSGGRPIELVDAGRSKELDVEVVVPLEDMREPGVNAEITDLLGTGGESRGQSIWPSIYPRLLELVEDTARPSSSSTTAGWRSGWRCGLNELAEKEIARVDHGSLAREQRLEVEELLKRCRADPMPRRNVVARARHRHGRRRPRRPGRVAEVRRSRLQRIGRAGHDLASVSKGRVFPVPRRPARVCRRRPPDEGGRDRGDADPPQSAGRPRAGRRDRARRRRSRSTSCCGS